MAAAEAAPLFHMVQESLWTAAKASGKPYFPPTYEQDGFIHLTADARFLLGIGNHFYKSVPGNWLLLCLDPARLTAKVAFEPAAPVGSTSSDGLTAEKEDAPLFPHLYGTIDYEAVRSELAIERDDSGAFLAIPSLGIR
ncbi:hypothetical protein HYH03_017513 [Edaphochlamys debaryana]|uniref:DUF952 domain-containing protein n=1 Tax=Edaphochlamys debaryana TaxID=47281 RepID=A0A835XMD8_9CHLO|nr:hypothetical protein HYH03_017513 [Edaphochlamys debaryana]|eukprot:KAG2483635.1 hypothetical protein HYH03_017513 [Edaphochlamys debaryana]